MLRAGLLTLLVGPVAASLTDECMKGLHALEGGSDEYVSLRCRAAFGPEACKQARQSLGAQPWTHAHMEGSCKQFTAAYEGMDARTLEAAVATKTSTDGAVSAKVAQQTPPAAPAPVQQPEEHEGPVAGLLAKLKEKKEEAEAKTEVAKGEHEERQEGPLAGLMNKLKEAKAAHEAQSAQDTAAKGEGEAERPLAGLVNKVKEAKAAHEAQAAQDTATEGEGEAEGPLAGLVNKVKEAKAAHEPQAAQDAAPEGDDEAEGVLAGLVNKIKEAKAEHEKNAAEQQGDEPPVLKLYGDVQIEQPAAAGRMHQVLGAFAGAASLAAVTFFVASRRAALSMSHEQLIEQLDAEQNAE